ncbi:hypothetical protein [Wolbachia endosymbiont (group A) of Conops quadrifasciatus]|uniref:hypothetical protein n=1 Tax=Wolbachia endosymbiont (group A) of Conops quadrifasciatus TaxID=3066143 RepID=UPI003132DB41
MILSRSLGSPTIVIPLLVSGIYPQLHDMLLGSAIEYRSEVTELKKRPNITQKAL